MNIKKIFLLLTSILIIQLIQSKECLTQTSEFVNFILPKQTTTANPKIAVEGTVEQKSIKHLKIWVEPFINRKNFIPRPSIVTVHDNYFREEILLFPGLNLIHVETMSKNIYAIKSIFFITPEKKDEEPSIDSWGRQSKIVFTQPSNLRLEENTVRVKGVVTDSSLRDIGIINMNAVSFLDVSGDKKEKGIDYQEVPVKNMVFECTVNLREGLNIILARPLGQATGFEDIQVKSLIFDMTAKTIVLNEPLFDNTTGNITIKGNVSRPNINSVDIEIKALVSEINNQFRIFPVVLVNGKVAVDKNGDFSINISLRGNKYIIKSPPIVSIVSRGTRASKTLLKW